MKKNYFELANNWKITIDDEMAIAEIFTLSAVKRLLAKNYDPHIDNIRRTYGQNKKAESLQEMTEQTEEEKLIIKGIRAEERAKLKELESLFLTAEVIDELNEDLQKIRTRLYSAVEDRDNLTANSYGNSLTDIADWFQEFRCGYIAERRDPQYLKACRTLLGFIPNTCELIHPPTLKQHRNRLHWATLNGRDKRKTLRHIAQIKQGQRAVNNHINHKKKGSANFSAECVSIDRMTEQGEQIINTKNSYITNEENRLRIKNLAKLSHLTPTQSRFLDEFCSKSAISAGIRAESEYHSLRYATACKNGKLKAFKETKVNKGYHARRKYVFEVLTANGKHQALKSASGQSKFLSKLFEKLAPYYSIFEEINLDEVLNNVDLLLEEPQEPAELTKEPATTPTEYKPPQPPTVWIDHILKSARPCKPGINTADKVQLASLEEQTRIENNSNWIIETDQTRAEQNANAYKEQHKSDRPSKAQTDLEEMRAEREKSRAEKEQERTARAEQERTAKQWYEDMARKYPPRTTAPQQNRPTIKKTYFKEYGTQKKDSKK